MDVARFYMKMVWFGLMLIFCIFFGVSLATTGIERIQGPITSPAAQKSTVKPVTAAVAASPSPSPSPSSIKKEQSIAKAPPVKEKNPEDIEGRSLNLVGNKLGDLLQIVSHHGIKWFVSIFDTVLGRG
jgi:hypothetical protein